MLKGYRTLSAIEIEASNAIKTKINELDDILKTYQEKLSPPNVIDVTSAMDPRWLALGRTYIQIGSMALIRSITKPETFA